MMDDLAESLQNSFQVTKELNSTACSHPRYSQYKQKTSNSDQDSRRRQLLEKQKSNRLNYANLVRKLTLQDWEDDEDEEEDDENEETMDLEEVKIKKPGRYYKDQLMLSEWLVEVPGDLKTEWLTVLCPIAKRCLVVTVRGTTRAYTKSGYMINTFPSELPGGRKGHKMNHGTVLDCLYSEAERTYYVLDLMCWNGHPVYDSETEFRFYWMHGKFQEHPPLASFSKWNPFKFIPLPSFVSEEANLKAALNSAKFEIDGLLFYHKRSLYTFGSTPLVVWLKPYMVPEILGIDVPELQLKGRPANYTNYAEHMKLVGEAKVMAEKLKATKKNIKKTRKPKNVEMADTEGPEEEELEENLEEESLESEPVVPETDKDMAT